MVKKIVRAGDVSKDAVAHRLRLVRKALNKTQADMARIMGCAVNTYQHMETGKTYPRPHYIQALMDSERIDHNFIYGGDISRLPHELFGAFEASARARDSG